MKALSFTSLSLFVLLAAVQTVGCSSNDANVEANDDDLTATGAGPKTYASTGTWATVSTSSNPDDLTENETGRLQFGKGKATFKAAKALPAVGSVLTHWGGSDTKIKATATLELSPELVAKVGSNAITIAGEVLCFASTTQSAQDAHLADNVVSCHIIQELKGHAWTVTVATDSQLHTTRVSAWTTRLTDAPQNTAENGSVRTVFDAD